MDGSAVLAASFLAKRLEAIDSHTAGYLHQAHTVGYLHQVCRSHRRRAQ